MWPSGDLFSRGRADRTCAAGEPRCARAVAVAAPFDAVDLPCSVALLPALRVAADAGRSSRIINIRSVDGLHVADQDNDSYTASKAALHMLTRHLARRLAPESITSTRSPPAPSRAA